VTTLFDSEDAEFEARLRCDFSWHFALRNRFARNLKIVTSQVLNEARNVLKLSFPVSVAQNLSLKSDVA
jgi:hypothetical protein